MDDADRQLWKLIGARIRYFRRQRGMSVDRLAQLVGVVRQQIVRIEAGMAGTPLPRLKLIADVLGVSLGDLLQDLDAEPTTEADNMVVSFRQRGLSDAEIQKILEYIELLEKARNHDS